MRRRVLQSTIIGALAETVQRLERELEDARGGAAPTNAHIPHIGDVLRWPASAGADAWTFGRLTSYLDSGATLNIDLVRNVAPGEYVDLNTRIQESARHLQGLCALTASGAPIGWCIRCMAERLIGTSIAAETLCVYRDHTGGIDCGDIPF